jgi:hypothetical protein
LVQRLPAFVWAPAPENGKQQDADTAVLEEVRVA